VVLYVGEGAGKDDDGRYLIYDPFGNISLQWNYQVVRLWEMAAENLLQLNQPALTTLIGLTHIQRPERELPQAVNQIRAVSDEMERNRMFTMLTALLPTKEVTEMVEKLLEETDFLLDTPFLRRMREMGREEGIELGRQTGLREAILEGAARKFDPAITDYRQLEQRLAELHESAKLQQVMFALFDAPDMTAVMNFVEEIGE
jgi:predicted transposase YdaD